MTIKIDCAEFLVDEAAQKFVELMACAGAVDLTNINDKADALVHADYLLSKIRDLVANQLLADARIFGEMAVEALEGGDVA